MCFKAFLDMVTDLNSTCCPHLVDLVAVRLVFEALEVLYERGQGGSNLQNDVNKTRANTKIDNACEIKF